MADIDDILALRGLKRDGDKIVMKPKCTLIGTDGNVFALAGRVQSALKKAGMHKEAEEFGEKLWDCEDYDAALQLMMEYVDVE